MIYHAVDHVADCTLSNSSLVTLTCLLIVRTHSFLSQLFQSLHRWPWSPRFHRVNDHELMARNPSTIEDQLPSCLPPSIVSRHSKPRLTVSLFTIHVTVRNHRHCDFSFGCLHKTLHTSNQVHSHQVRQYPHDVVPQFNLVNSLSPSTTISLCRCNSYPRPAVVPYDLPQTASIFVCSLSLSSRQMYLINSLLTAPVPSPWNLDSPDDTALTFRISDLSSSQ